MGQAVLFTKSKGNHKAKLAIYKATIQCNVLHLKALILLLIKVHF